VGFKRTGRNPPDFKLRENLEDRFLGSSSRVETSTGRELGTDSEKTSTGRPQISAAVLRKGAGIAYTDWKWEGSKSDQLHKRRGKNP